VLAYRIGRPVTGMLVLNRVDYTLSKSVTDAFAERVLRKIWHDSQFTSRIAVLSLVPKDRK